MYKAIKAALLHRRLITLVVLTISALRLSNLHRKEEILCLLHLSITTLAIKITMKQALPMTKMKKIIAKKIALDSISID